MLIGNRANLVNQAYSKCPNTKVVMGGYSQGGQIVHTAAQALPAATMNKVNAVLIFGDPGMSFHLFPPLPPQIPDSHEDFVSDNK
jgi:hypothetical protein